MARTPLIKFCLSCSQVYLDTTVTKCTGCGWVLKRGRVHDKPPTEKRRIEELREATLCCPTISCPVLKVGTKADVQTRSCDECGATLEVTSIYLWLDKVGSLTPEDMAVFLHNSDKLVAKAATATRLGLKTNTALTLLHDAIYEMSGVAFNSLEDWARQNIEPHVEQGTVTERTRYAALEAARGLGMDTHFAGIVFDQLAPPVTIISQPAEPVEPSENHHAQQKENQQEQKPRDVAVPSVAVVSTGHTPSVVVNPKPDAKTAHDPVPQATAATTTAAAVSQAADGLDKNDDEPDVNLYQDFLTLRYAGSYVTPWEYFKKTLLPLFSLMQRHLLISIFLSIWVIVASFIGVVSGLIEVVEYIRTEPERKPNRPPILMSIKCPVDPVEAGKPFLLEAIYEDEQPPEKLTFMWEVKDEEGVTGVENKPVIKLNAMSLKARGGIVLLRVTLKIRDHQGLESVERDKIVTVIANRPPSFNFTAISPTSVLPGTDVLLTAQYVDPDGDKVTYHWSSVPSATINKLVEDGSHVRLETTRFNLEKSRDMPVEISLFVTDGIVNVVQQHIIKVKSPESAKSADAMLSLTTPPPPTRFKLHRCKAEKDTVEKIGETVELEALASDSFDNNLDYTWETTAGRIAPRHGENVTLYTEGINPSTKRIKVTMTVTNGSGGSISHYIYINIKQPAPPATPAPEPTARPSPTQEIKPNSNSGVTEVKAPTHERPPRV